MRPINSFEMSAASGATGTLKGNPEIAKGLRAAALVLFATIPFYVVSGGSIVGGDMRDALAQVFASITYSFGKNSKQVEWNGIPFAIWREINIFQTGDDFYCLDSSGNPRELPSSGAGDTLYSGLGMGSTSNVTAVLRIPWTHKVLRQESRRWAPGATQFKTLEATFTRGAGFLSGSTLALNSGGTGYQTGAVSVNYSAETFPGADVWTYPPRPFLKNETTKDLRIDAPGLLLGVWERTAVGLSTSLGNLDIFHDDEELHANQSPIQLARESDYQVDTDDRDLGLHATVLYRPPISTPVEDYPVGEQVRIGQLASSASALNVVVLVAPAVDEAMAKAAMTHAVTAQGATQLSATNEAVARNPSIGAHVAASSGMIIAGQEDSGFESQSAIVATKIDGAVVTRPQVPDAVSGAAKAVVGQSTGAAARGVAKRLTVSVAKAIPGAVSPVRGITKQINKGRTAAVGSAAGLKGSV